MKVLFLSTFVLFLLSVTILSLLVAPVYAAVPFDEFKFQGVLKDASNNLLTETRDFTLEIYTTSLSEGDILSFDWDVAGSSNKGTGPKIWFRGFPT